MDRKKGAGLRTLFIVFCFAATIVSLIVARPSLSSLLVSIPVVIGFVFYIVASVALQVAHAAAGRPLRELLFVAAYPFLAYALVFCRIDFGSAAFRAFPGVFYFLTLTGGFILGTLLSPLLARRKGREWGEAAEAVWSGIAFLRALGLFASALIVLPALVLSLAGAALYLTLKLWSLTRFQLALLFLLLAAGTAVVVVFTFKQTVFAAAAPEEKAGRPNSPRSDR
ncbi:MAG: hypothetical protein JW742_04265 [Candidatus Aminicenantes bacterium]|nr:hypothetical protein [Candidatus Aminicenantes bacterium]